MVFFHVITRSQPIHADKFHNFWPHHFLKKLTRRQVRKLKLKWLLASLLIIVLTYLLSHYDKCTPQITATIDEWSPTKIKKVFLTIIIVAFEGGQQECAIWKLIWFFEPSNGFLVERDFILMLIKNIFNNLSISKNSHRIAHLTDKLPGATP